MRRQRSSPHGRPRRPSNSRGYRFDLEYAMVFEPGKNLVTKGPAPVFVYGSADVEFRCDGATCTALRQTRGEATAVFRDATSSIFTAAAPPASTICRALLRHHRGCCLRHHPRQPHLRRQHRPPHRPPPHTPPTPPLPLPLPPRALQPPRPPPLALPPPPILSLHRLYDNRNEE